MNTWISVLGMNLVGDTTNKSYNQVYQQISLCKYRAEKIFIAVRLASL